MGRRLPPATELFIGRLNELIKNSYSCLYFFEKPFVHKRKKNSFRKYVHMKQVMRESLLEEGEWKDFQEISPSPAVISASSSPQPGPI